MTSTPKPVSFVAPTMTSLEIVEFINSNRKAAATRVGASFPSKNFAELAHYDFYKKVPTVLGERAGNFSVTFEVPGPNGAVRQSPGYRFPKREACLMAMSYSYDLQAQVFDRMTLLEEAAKLAALPPQPIPAANLPGVPASVVQAIRQEQADIAGLRVQAGKVESEAATLAAKARTLRAEAATREEAVDRRIEQVTTPTNWGAPAKTLPAWDTRGAMTEAERARQAATWGQPGKLPGVA